MTADTERPPLSLDEAIELLVDVHTRAEEPPLDYAVIAGAPPGYHLSYWHQQRYSEAWGTLLAHRDAGRQRLEQARDVYRLRQEAGRRTAQGQGR